jgi:hypothetical protein
MQLLMIIVFGSKKQYFRGETPIISLFGGASFTSLGAAYFSVICLSNIYSFFKNQNHEENDYGSHAAGKYRFGVRCRCEERG